jgi:hypothetical protein
LFWASQMRSRLPLRFWAAWSSRSVTDTRYVLAVGSVAPLIEVDGLVPGDEAVECIAVTYEGDAVPAAVTMAARVDGSLGRSLSVQSEIGSGGNFEDCTGFRSTGVLFTGTLDDMADAGEFDAFVAPSSPVARSFRMTFTMQSDAPDTAGDATADFIWEAKPA